MPTPDLDNLTPETRERLEQYITSAISRLAHVSPWMDAVTNTIASQQAPWWGVDPATGPDRSVTVTYDPRTRSMESWFAQLQADLSSKYLQEFETELLEPVTFYIEKNYFEDNLLVRVKTRSLTGQFLLTRHDFEEGNSPVAVVVDHCMKQLLGELSAKVLEQDSGDGVALTSISHPVTAASVSPLV